MVKMEKFDLSVVMPTLNSETFIKTSIKKMKDFLNQCRLVNNFEILVMAQTSDDKTFDILRKIKDRNVRAFFIKKRGKGGAVTEGIRNTKYHYVLMIDDDLPYKLSFIDKALSEIDKYDIVVASRYCRKMRHHAPLSRKIASFFYRKIVRLVFSIPQKDIQAGMKLMKKSIFSKIPFPNEKRYVWDTEFLYFANKNKLRIKEIPEVLKQKPNYLKISRTTFEIIYDLIKLRLRTL